MYKGWLCVVEDMMHKSLKEVLRACRLDLKKHLSKREKWVREWPGQVSKCSTLFSKHVMEWFACVFYCMCRL